MSFSYFISAVDEDVAVVDGKLQHGAIGERLGEVLRDCVDVPNDMIVTSVGGGGGPDGQSGLLLIPKPTDGSTPDQVTYDAKKFKHRHLGGKTWLLWQPSNLPTPETLVRRRQIAGYELTEEGRGRWVIPVARTPDSEHGLLPKRWGFDPEGKPQAKLDKAYQDVWEFSRDVWETLVPPTTDEELDAAKLGTENPETKAIDVAWSVETTRKILEINYRVGAAELDVLEDLERGILSEANVYLIPRLFVDLRLAVEAKKN